MIFYDSVVRQDILVRACVVLRTPAAILKNVEFAIAVLLVVAFPDRAYPDRA